MNRNGGIPPQFTQEDFKPDPCGCGGVEFDIDRFASFFRHRFKPEIKATQISERFTCRKCGHVHGTPYLNDGARL